MSEPWHVQMVISSGATGAESGALLGAKDAGVETGGWANADPIVEDGRVPTYAQAPDAVRCMNARDADATLAISYAEAVQWRGPGRGSVYASRKRKKGTLHVRLLPEWSGEDIPDRIIEQLALWLERHAVRILHVTGPNEKHEPGIEAMSRALVGLIIERAAGTKDGPATLFAELGYAGIDRSTTPTSLRHLPQPPITVAMLERAAEPIPRSGGGDPETPGEAFQDLIKARVDEAEPRFGDINSALRTSPIMQRIKRRSDPEAA